MKKFYFIFCFLFFINFSYSQNKDLQEKLKSIENQWSIDESNRIVYEENIDILNAKKHILFERAQKFFAFSFIPTYDDVDIYTFNESQIICAKGNIPFSQKVNEKNPRKERYISTVFTLEIFENKVKVTVFFIDFITDYGYIDTPNTIKKYYLSSVYPFEIYSTRKQISGITFYESFIFTKEKIKELKEYLSGNLNEN